MFADQDFADFSQEIGLASLGASDEEVKKLATCYWFSVEFGLVKGKEKDGKVKAYGAGLLSSFGELEYSCAKSVFPVQSGDPNLPLPDKPRLLPWDPKVAGVTDYPITCYQPTYFVVDSLPEIKKSMRRYCENLHKPFHARFNQLTNSVWVDRAVRTDESSFENTQSYNPYAPNAPKP
jgi:phenylalanine-4-hydroxylase